MDALLALDSRVAWQGDCLGQSEPFLDFWARNSESAESTLGPCTAFLTASGRSSLIFATALPQEALRPPGPGLYTSPGHSQT